MRESGGSGAGVIAIILILAAGGITFWAIWEWYVYSLLAPTYAAADSIYATYGVATSSSASLLIWPIALTLAAVVLWWLALKFWRRSGMRID